MSAARTILAISALTFVLLIGITLIVPSFPPAQLLYEYVRIPQTTSSIWGISIATLLNGTINGCYWAIIVIPGYGVARLAVHGRKPKSLRALPVAPHLITPPPENPLVDSRDLLRVRGIGRKYSALLVSAGVNTVTDLSTKNPRYLCQTLKAVNSERNLVGRKPCSRTIESWVNNAKNLEPTSVE
jgi:predicted flap endonuclease-1-like 5' DNA nuclease